MAVLATITNKYLKLPAWSWIEQGFHILLTPLALRAAHGPEAELHFISGADAILDLLGWKDVDELVGAVLFIAATRPGYQLSEQLQRLQEDYPNRVFRVEVPALAISSTDIRRRVELGKSIKYLLPEPVEHYIYKNKLYLSPEESSKFCIS